MRLPACVPQKTPDKTPAELHIAVLMFTRNHCVADLDEVRKEWTIKNEVRSDMFGLPDLNC